MQPPKNVLINLALILFAFLLFRFWTRPSSPPLSPPSPRPPLSLPSPLSQVPRPNLFDPRTATPHRPPSAPLRPNPHRPEDIKKNVEQYEKKRKLVLDSVLLQVAEKVAKLGPQPEQKFFDQLPHDRFSTALKNLYFCINKEGFSQPEKSVLFLEIVAAFQADSKKGLASLDSVETLLKSMPTDPDTATPLKFTQELSSYLKTTLRPSTPTTAPVTGKPR